MPARSSDPAGTDHSIQTISVIVPANPFIGGAIRDVVHCLAALDAVKLMDWWPGTPHAPHRDADKVRAIQRSLDWKQKKPWTIAEERAVWESMTYWLKWRRLPSVKFERPPIKSSKDEGDKEM